MTDEELGQLGDYCLELIEAGRPMEAYRVLVAAKEGRWHGPPDDRQPAPG